MVKKFEKEFRDPSSEYRSCPFWAWNTRLDKEELIRQIDAFKKMGFGGFYMHSRIGAPLRSVINYCRHYRDRYGDIDIVYGSRSKDDLLDYKEIIEEWSNDAGVKVHLTIDREQEGWDGHVGFVPTYVKELGFDTNKTAVLCGPPIMIKFTLEGLCSLGFDKTQIYTTLELRMKCGVGKCGRCNVGAKYVCKDGPVFRCDELDELPDEY